MSRFRSRLIVGVALILLVSGGLLLPGGGSAQHRLSATASTTAPRRAPSVRSTLSTLLQRELRSMPSAFDRGGRSVSRSTPVRPRLVGPGGQPIITPPYQTCFIATRTGCRERPHISYLPQRVIRAVRIRNVSPPSTPFFANPSSAVRPTPGP